MLDIIITAIQVLLKSVEFTLDPGIGDHDSKISTQHFVWAFNHISRSSSERQTNNYSSICWRRPWDSVLVLEIGLGLEGWKWNRPHFFTLAQFHFSSKNDKYWRVPASAVLYIILNWISLGFWTVSRTKLVIWRCQFSLQENVISDIL